MRVLALAGYDSFLKTARLIAPYFQQEGCSVDYRLIKARRRRQISESQVAIEGLKSEANWTTIYELFETGTIFHYDIILSCLENASQRRLNSCLERCGQDRPLLISVYPGLIFRHVFDGYSLRASSDLFWLNCEADRSAFLRMCRAFNLDTNGARVFGVAPLLNRISRADSNVNGPVVFFEQAVIPCHYNERLFLAHELIKLAIRFPHLEFKIKLRSAPREFSLHRSKYALSPLLHKAARRLGGWPGNLVITTQRVECLLGEASHCLTVSSTVAAEAIYAGVPTTIIGDFGAMDEYGLSYFFESGLITSFANIDPTNAPAVNQEWLYLHIGNPTEKAATLVQEAVSMAGEPRPAFRSQALQAERSHELRRFMAKRNGLRNFFGGLRFLAAFWKRPPFGG